MSYFTSKGENCSHHKEGERGGNKVHLPKICHIYVVMMKVDTVIPAKENPKKGLEKGLKLQVKKFLGLIPTFVEVAVEKLVGEPFYPSSHPK